MIKKKYQNNIYELLAWIVALVFIIPILMVALSSLKTSSEANIMNMQLPQSLQWQNYVEVFKRGDLLKGFLNSVFTSAVPTIIVIITSSMAAFVMSRNRTKLNKFIYNIFFLGLMAPINYITTIKVLQFFNIMNSYTGIIVIWIALGFPFAIYIFYGFFNSIPVSLDEAAAIDGCNSFQIYWMIIFPLLKPAIVTITVLTFIGAWNDFVTPLYILADQNKWGMVMKVYNFFGMYFNEWNMIGATILMTIIPVLVIYVFGQKFIIDGMVAGAVKD